jgi:hypothetical protein
MTNQQATLIWKSADQKRNSFYPQVNKLTRSALNRQIAPVILAIREGELEADTLVQLVSQKPIEELFLKIYPMVGASFARDSYRQILSQQKMQRKAEPVSDWMNYMRNFALTRAGMKIVNITDTTRKFVRKILDKAISEGFGIDKTARLMQDEYAGISLRRAEVISRTEIISSSNSGSLAGARSTGLRLNKIWVSTKDNRTRRNPKDKFDHVEADQQEVDLEASFRVSGEELDVPGVGGSAGNTIQCRCTVAYRRKTV